MFPSKLSSSFSKSCRCAAHGASGSDSSCARPFYLISPSRAVVIQVDAGAAMTALKLIEK